MSGDYVVEDVVGGDSDAEAVRRLIFLENSETVQSEVALGVGTASDDAASTQRGGKESKGKQEKSKRSKAKGKNKSKKKKRKGKWGLNQLYQQLPVQSLHSYL